ncbi:MAG: hypothetical protein EOP19_04510 [Hyphomicrobiales bacterium]|nr:MAG: hypothetical protein EOP19_04510 [Hyphomicrobiales bacterium]
MLLRVFVLLCLCLGTFVATAVPASANVLRPISAKVGVGELRGACSSAGGTFSVHADGGGYGCEKKDCDGKGGTCIVACDNNNNCNGSTPTRITTPMTIVGILQDGNLVLRDPVVRGTDSLSGPVTGGAAATPSEPIKPPGFR